VKDRERQRQLRGDLDAILVRALQKDPNLRYSSVGEFAQDIRSHLSGKLVQARANKFGYRIATALLHNRRVQIASAAAMVCLIAAGLGVALRAHLYNKVPRTGAGDGDKTSIAVLPFDSLTADQANSYFADGVQDAILTSLANVSALKVISRGSVAAYRGKQKNEREIGRALGVSYVLEGSVQKDGDRIRVNAQLIDTRTLTEVWAQQYDQKLDDLFAVESDLAQAIASQLRGKLSPDEKAAIENRPTKDMLAYDLYLRARESFFQSNSRNALRLLEQAVARDPQFALAYCLSAEVQLCMYRYKEDMTPERLAKAKDAAETALRIAPKLPQSYLAKAQYYYYGLHDYEKTLRELNAAPSSTADKAQFANLAALTERRLGRWTDAIRDGEMAVELDPQNPFAINELVESYLAVRRFSDAEQLADKGIKEVVSQTAYLWRLKSEALIGLGKIEEALAVLDNSPRGMSILYQHVWTAVLLRDFARASQLLSNAPNAEKESYTHPFFDAMAARAEGNVGRARTSFELARDRIIKKLVEQPDNPELVSNLSVADAGLGHKEEALREASRAIELCPMSRDVVEAPSYQTMLALVYAWSGEHDAALTELEKAVRLPRGPSYGELRFNPFWDDLRANARFDALLTQAVLPPLYN